MIFVRPIAIGLFWLSFVLMALCNLALMMSAQLCGFLGRVAGYAPKAPPERTEP